MHHEKADRRMFDGIARKDFDVATGFSILLRVPDLSSQAAVTASLFASNPASRLREAGNRSSAQTGMVRPEVVLRATAFDRSGTRIVGVNKAGSGCPVSQEGIEASS
jgi:hypothetical protein